ncbi:protein rolling stone-like [Astyanax mexicanus]|uniref:Protein rolling stone-like n=1 Tax=Astyanax mexicanus TaxID=7994 RepID=A0A8T2KS15_ASTMX|nr:protein rolling stone-like [Astyanax mexicanus]
MGSVWTQSFREELTVRKLKFTLTRPELLLQPQWSISPRVWFLYRLFMLLYTFSWCLYLALLFSTPKWLLFLSHIVYCIMGIYYLLAFCNLVWAAVQVRRFYRSQSTASEDGYVVRGGSVGPFPLPPLLSAALRLQWCLHNLVGSFSVTVSLLYWTLVYPIEKHPLSTFNINMHVGNSIQTLLDLVLSSTPVHLAHYLHLFLGACLYIAFTLLYWFSGGTNLSNKPYIYKVLDYGGCPLVAAFSVLGVVCVCLPISHFLVWNVCYLRRSVATGARGGSLGLCRERWWWKVGGATGGVVSLTGIPASIFTPAYSGTSQPLLASRNGLQGAMSVYL